MKIWRQTPCPFCKSGTPSLVEATVSVIKAMERFDWLQQLPCSVFFQIVLVICLVAASFLCSLL